MNRLGLGFVSIFLFLNTMNCSERIKIEDYFYKYGDDFIEYVNSKIDNREFKGEKRWVYAHEWVDFDVLIVDFIIGKDYKESYYKPKIVYIESDNYMDCPHCKGDGELIKKIKKNWFVCRAERF